MGNLKELHRSTMRHVLVIDSDFRAREEFDPVDEETDEDEVASSRDPSNADSFSAFETAMEWYEQQSQCCPTQLLLLKRIRDLAAKKRKCTMVQRIFSTKKVTLRHLAPIMLFLQACDDFQHSYSVRVHIIHGSHSVFRTIAYLNGDRSQLIRINDVLLYFEGNVINGDQ
ncbi:uncharacterized protein TNCV_1342571 [Trichonephila clavipes]|nr:uncharacterized protein TNCV_1342571 [Trichonephila clavipes]